MHDYKKNLKKTIKRWLLLLIGLAMTVGLAGYMYQYGQQSRAGAWNVSALFTPTEIRLDNENKEAFVDIYLNTTAGEKISYARVQIEFPSDIVFFDGEVPDKCNNLNPVSTNVEHNTITIIRDKFAADSELPDGRVCFSRLRFLPKAAGSRDLTFADTENWEIQGPLGEANITLSDNAATVTITVAEETGLATPTPSSTTPTATIYPTPPDEYAPSCKKLYDYFWKHNNSSCFDDNYLAVADINRDGKVNTADIDLLKSKKQDESYCFDKLVKDTTDPCKAESVHVNYRIRLQGITTQPKKADSIDMKVALHRNDTTVDTRSITFTPQADGTWVADSEYKNIPATSDYYITVKGPKHLQKRICENNPQESVDGTYRCRDGKITLKAGTNTLDFSRIFMLAGDLPLQNGIVDAVDITYIRSNIGSQNTEVVARGDLNYDGIVDSQDYTIVINALSFKYDEDE